MKIEITKTFINQVNNKHYIINDNVGLKHTEIFRKIKFYLEYETKFEDIKDILNKCKSNCKSRCEISYYEDRIEIFKPNKYIFPEILILKNK